MRKGKGVRPAVLSAATADNKHLTHCEKSPPIGGKGGADWPRFWPMVLSTFSAPRVKTRWEGRDVRSLGWMNAPSTERLRISSTDS